ncbi:DUF4054 domain-containing protein [Acetobacteraceae bacterium]|nr:DUF4054 domain-containing protein [Acetobacteraceae bacterium]
MSNTSLTAGKVIFDPAEWKKTFPIFADLTDAQAQFNFDCACDYLNNSAASPIRNLRKRQRLLWLLTAHLSQLSLNGTSASENGTSGMVGRISSASRGSVSLSTDASGIPRSGWWFAQTPYGAAFWQATLPLRQMRFLPGHPHAAKIWP